MKLLLNPKRVVFTEDETKNILAEYLSERGMNQPVQIEIERSAVPPVVKPESKKKELSFEEFKYNYTNHLFVYSISEPGSQRGIVKDFLRSICLPEQWFDSALTMFNCSDAERAWNVYQRIR